MKSKKDRKKRSKRNEDKRPRQRYLIVAEDTKSSLDYFKAFPVDQDLVEIVAKGGAGDTCLVVKEAIKLRDEAKRAQSYARVFCIFDKDDHEKRYEEAFEIAGRHNDITAIWANECYELWLMLHYHYQNTPIERKKIYRFLNGKFDGDYHKGSSNAYNVTKDLLETAMRNSTKLLAQAEDPSKYWLTNPSTNIHELVKKLIDLEAL